MSTFHKKQKAELTSMGLSYEQISACERLFETTPMLLDVKGVTKAAKLIEQAYNVLSKIEANDLRFFEEISTQLEITSASTPSTLSTISETLKKVVEHQNGVHVTESDSITGETVSRVTTPKSKNFYRYDGLSQLWSFWGKEVKTSDGAEFLSFITICIEGRFSIDGANRARTHYQRYYQGKKVTHTTDDLWELELVTKAKDGVPSKTLRTAFNTPDGTKLNSDIKKLIKQRG
jgi:hypothetical protein